MSKKTLKIIFLILIIGLVFTIYSLFKSSKINYIALGDSLVEGMNPYGEIGYSYTDYINDKLNNSKRINYYKKIAKSGWKTEDLIREILIDNRIKKDLRESDLVTISIGANDFLSKIDKNSINIEEILKLKENVLEIFPNIENCIKEVRKYAKQNIIIIGYYNPIPFLFNTSNKDLDELFSYIDFNYKEIADKYHCKYISLYYLFKKNSSFLPNPSDIHPNLKGYEAIANQVLETIKKLLHNY